MLSVFGSAWKRLDRAVQRNVTLQIAKRDPARISCSDDGDELPLAGELLAPGLVAVDAVEAQVGGDDNEDGVLDGVFVGEDWAHGGRDGEDELLDGVALGGCKPG